MDFNANPLFPNTSNPKVSGISPELLADFNSALAQAAPEFRPEPNPLFTRFPNENFGLYETNYERYARRSNFDELGFSPYRDNDAIYNAEANFAGELWRGLQGAAMLTGSTAFDMLKGTGDILTLDFKGLMAPDMGAAAEFEDINRIYGSTKGGATGFIANGATQLGFIGGMVLGSLPESAALAFATAEAGGAAGFLNIGRKIGQGLRIIDKAADATAAAKAAQAASATSTVLKNAETVRGAGAVADWLATTSPQIAKITGNPILKFFNPLENTVGYIDDVAKAASAGTALPSIGKGVGAVMRDGQIFKAAAVEASLEGGFVAKNLSDKALNEFYETNGRLPNEEELAEIKEKVTEAGARTTAWNLPVILFTDKLLFGPMLNKLDKTISRGIGADLQGLVRNADGTVAAKQVLGASARKSVTLEGKEFLNSLLQPGKYLTRGSAFLKNGLGEGAQEVFQEYASKTMEDYYGDILSSPMGIPKMDVMGYLKENISNTGADEGLAFLSGAFVGGVAGGAMSKVAKAAKINAGINTFINQTNESGEKMSFKERYQAYKAEQQKINNELADTINSAIQSPVDLFERSIRTNEDTKKLLRQIQIGNLIQDEKLVRDAAEELRFNKIYTALDTGTFDLLTGKLATLKQLDDVGIVEATGSANAEEARARLDKTIQRANEIKNRYDSVKSKYPNPFDYSMYEYATDAYNQAYLANKGYEEALRDYIFMGETIDKLKERNASLKSAFGSTSIAPKITSLDVDVITNLSNLRKEMSLLSDEVLAEDAAVTPDQKKIIANKKARLKVLTEYNDALNAFHAAEKEGKGTKRKEAKLKSSFAKVVSHLNEVSEVESQYSEDSFNELFAQLKDYQRNDIDSLQLGARAATLGNYSTLIDYAKRHSAAMNDVFVNKRKYIKRSVDNFMSAVAQNQNLHSLKEAGYAIPEEELMPYIEEGKIPQNLISLKNGTTVPTTDPSIEGVLETILKPYALTKEEDVKEQEIAKQREEAKAQPKAADTEEARKTAEAIKIVAQISAAEMDNPQAYRALVAETPEVAEVLADFMDAVGDNREAFEFIVTSEGTAFMAFVKKAVDAKKLSSFANDSLKRYLGSQAALNSQVLNDAFDSIIKGEKYQDLGVFLSKFVKVAKVEGFENELGEGVKLLASYPEQDLYLVSLEDYENVAEGSTAQVQYWVINSQQVPNEVIHANDKIYVDLDAAKNALADFLETGSVNTKKNRFTFDGNVLRPGTVILNSNGTRYQVIGVASTDETGRVNAIQIQKQNSKNRPETIKNFNGYTVQTDIKVSEDASKLSPTAEFGYVKRPQFVTGEHNVKLSEYYNSVSETEFLESLVFEVSAPMGGELTETNLQYGGRGENPRIKKRSTDRGSVAVYAVDLTGEPLLLGYLNDPREYIFYSADGKRMEILTKEMVNADLFYGTPNADNVIRAYNNSLNLYDYLVSARGSNNMARIPYSEVSQFATLSLASPGYLFAGEDKVSFSDLKYKTYDGSTVVIDRYQGDAPIVLSGSLTFDQVKEITSVVNSSKAVYENLGRYVLVSKIPNGRVIFTELSAKQMEATEAEALVKELVAAASNKKLNKKEFGDQFNSKLFFAYTGKDTFNDSNVKYKVTFNIVGTEDKLIEASFLPLSGSVKAEQKIRFAPTAKSLEEFINLFNIAIEENNKQLDKSANLKYVKLDPVGADNFYQNISKNITQDDLANTKSNVTHPEMISVNGIKIVDVAGATPMGAVVEDMTSKPAPAVVQEELPAITEPVTDISDVEAKKADIENNDFVIKIKKIGQSYAGGKQFVNTKQTGKEFLEQVNYEMYGEKVQAEHLLYFKDKFDGALYDLINRGYKELTGKTFEEYDAELAALKQQPTSTTQPSTSVKEGVEEGAQPSAGIETFVDTLSVFNNDMLKQDLLVAEAELESYKEGLDIDQTFDNPELDRLENRVNELKKQLNIAYKNVDSYTPETQQELANFLDWVKNSLPSYIEVATVETIADRMISEGITVGRFSTIVKNAGDNINEISGLIEIVKDSPAKYHEAFHSVFRLILTDKEIQRALAQGEKELVQKLKTQGRSLDSVMNEYRKQPFYFSMTTQELKERVVEEYLADTFEEFKKNPRATNTAVSNKSTFRKIIDFLINLFKVYRPRFESNDDLFEGIADGRFRKAGIANNKYTRSAINNGGDVAFAVMLNKGSVSVSTGSGIEVIPQYVNSQDTQYLMSALVSRVYTTLQADPSIRTSEAIKFAIIDFARLFNPERYSNVELKERASALLSALKSPVNRSEIEQHIRESLKTFNNVRNLLNDAQEELEEDFGGNTSKSFFKSKEELDGVTSLPTVVKALISTTPVVEADAFGNEFFVDREGNLTEERIIVPASVQLVYNTITRITADSVDEIEALNRMLAFTRFNSDSSKNSHGVQFINHAFKVFNIVADDSGAITKQSLLNVRNAATYQAFIKAFAEKSKRDYTFTAVDSRNKKKKSYDANRRSEGTLQYDSWRSAYNAKVDSITDETAKEAADILSNLTSIVNNVAVYDQSVSTAVKDGLTRFGDITGIEIAPAFYEYSWYKYKISENKLEMTEANAEVLSTVRLLSLPVLTPEILNQIGKSLLENKGTGLFLRDDSESSNEELYTVGGRVKALASGNVFFNENIDTTSFTNANGNKIQTYQVKTVLTKLVQALKQGLPTDAYRADNYLANNKEFLAILPEINTKSIDGLAARSLDNAGVSFNQQAGTVYADYTDREFLFNILSQYTEVEVINGVVTVPHFIRVLEAASTGMTVNLPVTKAVDFKTTGWTVNSEYLDALVAEVERDVRRIAEVQDQIEKVENPALDESELDFDIIENYHRGDKLGLKLSHNLRSLLGAEFSEKIESGLATDAELRKNLESSLIKSVDQFVDKLIQNNLLQRRKGLLEIGDSPLVSVVGRSGIAASKAARFVEDLNLFPMQEKDAPGVRNIRLEASIAQIFLSSFLNVSSFNQLLMGDHNKQFKDSKNVVKRAKGLNASGISTSHSTLAPELGINKKFDAKGDLVHITFPNDLSPEKTKRDDGQLYMTVNGLRYILFGMGRLREPAIANFLDKIQNGLPVSEEEVFGLNGTIQYNSQTNSLKLVYYDGETYLKMSAVVLTPELTTRFSSPGAFLDNLRRVLEKAEETATVAFGHPESAEKTFAKNAVSSRTDITPYNEVLFKKHFNALDPNFLYLSTEIPSNKTKITDPTQMKSILISGFSNADKVYVDGQEVSAVAAIKELLQLSAKRTESKYFERRKKTFEIEDFLDEFTKSLDLGKVTPKLDSFRLEAVDTLKSIGASPQEIEIFERGDINLNNPVTLSRFYTLFLSYFSKGVGKDIIPGYKLTLISDSGIVIRRRANTAISNGTSVDTVVTSDEYLRMSEAERKNVYDDRLRHDVKVYDKAGKIIDTYAEMLMPSHFRGKSLDSERTMHSVRIPSQASQSATNSKVVDYMPAYYGSSAILPQELIDITGWDFDADSIFVHRPFTYRFENRELVYGEEKTVAEKKAAYFNSLINNNEEYALELSRYEDPTDEVLREDITQKMGIKYTEEKYRATPEYINNRILKLKTALQGSESRTVAKDSGIPKSYQPMKTVSYDAFERKVKEESPEFANFIDAQVGIHDSILGQLDFFGNIREGAENIGPAVNGVLAYSLLNLGRVSGNEDAGFTVNGNRYNTFENVVDTDGNDISDNMSQTVSIMVDNTSNPVARMYGMSLEQTGVAAYMTSLGVSVEDALLFINQPIVRHFSNALKNSRSSIKVKSADKGASSKEIMDQMIQLFKAKLKTEADDVESISQYKNAVDASAGYETLKYSVLPIEKAIEEMPISEVENQLKLLFQFDKVKTQAQIFSDFAKLTKLNQGVGKDSDSFDRYLELADMFTTEEGVKSISNSGFPVEGITTAISNNDYLTTQIKALKELSKLFRTVFIDRSPVFGFVQESLENVLSPTDYIKRGAVENIRKDLMSVITASAYMNKLEDGDMRNSNLSNALIYEALKTSQPSVKDITQIVGSLRRYYSDKGVRNRFIQDYLFSNPAKKINGQTNTKNREQVNRVSLNSWSKLSPEIGDMLYRDFVDGISNSDVLDNGITVRSAFLDLVHYLMVKDGLNFKSGSFLSYVAPIALRDIFASNNEAINVLKDAEGMLTKSSKVFGGPLDVFIGDFLINWPKHAVNQNAIKTLFTPDYKDERKEIFDALFKQVTEDRLNVSIFGYQSAFEENLNVDQESEGYADYFKKVAPVFGASQFNSVKFESGTKTEFPLYIIKDKNLYKLYYYYGGVTDSEFFNTADGKARKISIGNNNVVAVLNASKRELGRVGFFGSFAQYEKVNVKGNRSQTGAGYIFGDLPNYTLLESQATTPTLKTEPAATRTVTPVNPKLEQEAVEQRSAIIKNAVLTATTTDSEFAGNIDFENSNLGGRRITKVPTSFLETLNTYQLTEQDRNKLRQLYENKAFTTLETGNIDVSSFSKFMDLIEETIQVNRSVQNLDDIIDRMQTCYGITINL
jgi:hypothetical protein